MYILVGVAVKRWYGAMNNHYVIFNIYSLLFRLAVIPKGTKKACMTKIILRYAESKAVIV